MTEATSTLSANRQLRLEQRRNAMVVTMARYIARQRVKEELRKAGIRLSLIETVEISKATNMLLAVCRDELIAEARSTLSRFC